MTDPGAPTRRHALDVLRGIAVLLVVTWHYLPQPWTPVQNGALAAIRRVNALSWSGVDLFFVLSGFLIVGILIDNRLATNYFRTFYIRRFFRIVPLYVLVLVFAAFSIDWRTEWKSYLAHLIFQQNAVVASTGVWGLPRLEVTWSLAVEEQFYMIAPLVVRLARPRRLPLVLLGCIAVAPLFRVAMWAVLPPARAPFAAMTLLPCRMDSLAVGALVAWTARDPAWRRRLAERRLLMAAAAVAGTLGVVIPIGAGWTWPSIYVSTVGLSFIAMFYGVVLVVFLRASAERLVTSPLLRPFTAAGIGAYSIYLFHFAIRETAYAAMPVRRNLLSWALYGAVLVGANAVVALCCWTLVERPMIRRGHRARYDVGVATRGRPATVAGA
jgi:peptidoglycan/LPS O-acetylase OafA/YrhL